MTPRTTVKAAYETLKKMCEPNGVDEEFEKLGKRFRTILRKEMNMLQNWYCHKMAFEEYHKDEELSEAMVLKMFLMGLPKEYQDVAKECYREKLTAEQAVRRLDSRAASKKAEETAKVSRAGRGLVNKDEEQTDRVEQKAMSSDE